MRLGPAANTTLLLQVLLVLCAERHAFELFIDVILLYFTVHRLLLSRQMVLPQGGVDRAARGLSYAIRWRDGSLHSRLFGTFLEFFDRR